MDPRLQLRVQRYGWDRAAGAYDAGWRRQLAPAHRKLLEMADLRPGEAVLDVASGTGLVTAEAARAVGPDGSVVAVDLSEEMVAATADRAAREGLFGRVRARRMNAEELEFADGAFDAALSALGLMYAPDPARALREMRRVLRPGGRAVAAVWGARARCGWADIFPIVDARVRTEVCPLFFALGTGDSLSDAFAEAGFAGIETERFSTLLEYADAGEALAAAFEGGPVALAYRRFDDRAREEAHREYLASIEPYREGDRYRIPGEFVVTRGLEPAAA